MIFSSYPTLRSFALLSLFLSFFGFAQAQDNCNVSTSWTLNPPVPASGAYDAGTTVEVCLDVAVISMPNANWLSGIEFNLPPIFDPSTIANLDPPESCSGNGGGTGEWLYLESVTCGGQTYGPGFYYDVNVAGPQDGNPCNNWGDPCFGAGFNWTLCFEITLDADCGGPGNPFDGTDITPSVTLWGDGDIGSWGSSTGCTSSNESAPSFNFSVNCCDAESGGSPGTLDICENGNFCLFDELLPPVDANGFWIGPPGWTPDACGTFDPTSDPPGEYTYSVQGSDGCINSTSIFMEFIDLGLVASVAYCGTAPICLDNQVPPGTLDPGGNWFEPDGTPLPDCIIDPANNPPGTYVYEFYDAGNCLTTASLNMIFATGGAAGSPNTVDLCAEDPTCFNPFEHLGGNPTGGGQWILYGNNGGFLDFFPANNVCIDPSEFFTDYGLAYDDSFVFQYVLGAPPCEPAFVDVTVNYHPLVNTGVFTETSICVTDAPVVLESLLNGTVDFGYEWTNTSGGAVIPNTLDPSVYAPDGTTLQLQYSGGLDNSACFNSTILVLNILPANAEAGTSNTITVCESGLSFNMLDSLDADPNDPSDDPQSGGVWIDPNGNTTGNFFTPGSNPGGNYTYTITSTCDSDVATLTINVTPTPDPGTNIVQDICDNAGNVQLQTGGTPDPGGTWSPGDPSGIVDASTLSGGEVYTYTVGPGYCQESSTVSINLLNAPNAGTLVAPPTYCVTDGNIDLMTLFNNPPSVSNPGYWSGPSSTPGGILNTATATTGTYTYTIPDNSCGPASVSVLITIEAAPNPGTDVIVNVCPNGGIVNLFSSLPGAATGGTWTAPAGGPTNGQFDPSVPHPAGVYTYEVESPSGLCVASADVTVQYTTLLDPGADNTITVCETDAPFNLIDQLNGTPQGPGSWTGPTGLNVNPAEFTPGNSLPGNYVYQVTTAGCPPQFATLTVNVDDLPVVGIDTDVTLCASEGLIDLTTYLDGNADPVSWNVANPYDISTEGGNTLSFTATATNGTCTASADLNIIVENEVDAGNDTILNFCADGSTLDLNNLPAGNVPSGSGWDPDQFVVLDPANSGVYTLTVPGGACPDDEALYTININPEISISNLQANCSPSQTTYSVSFDISGGSGAYLVNGNAVGPGTYTSLLINVPDDYGFTIEDAAGICPNLDITGPAPACACPATAAFVGGNQDICIGSSANIELDLSGTGPFEVVYNNGTGNDTLFGINDGYLLNVSPTTTTTYSLVSVEDANCLGSAAGSITVNVEPLPNAGPDVTADFCASGTTLNLNTILDPSAQTPGSWTPQASIALNAANSGVYTYTVEGTECPDDAAQYTINIDPQITTSNLQVLCAPSQTTYTVSFNIQGGDGNYSIGGSTVTANFVSAPIPVGTPYSFTISDSGVCADITVSGNSPNCSCPATAAFVGGSQDICIGSSTNIELDLSGTGPFDVVYNDGSGNDTLFGINDGYLLNVSPTTTTTYSLVSVEDANCLGSAAGSVTVNVEPLPNAGPDVTADFCASGTTLNLNTILDPSAQTPGSWTPQASIALTAANSGVYTYTVEGTECPDDAAQYTINIDPQITTSNLQVLCAPSQTTYTVSFNIQGGDGNYSIGGSTVTANFVSAPIPVGTPYSFTISDSGVCADITVSGNSPNCACPATAAFVGGDQSICIGSSANIELDLSGTGPFDVVYNDGSGNDTLFGINDGYLLNVSPTATTTYSLISVEDANCQTSAGGSVTVNVEALPNAGSNVSADFCGDGSVITLSTLVPPGINGSFGQTTVIADPANSGTYVLTASGNLCPDDQANYNLNFDPEISITNLTAVCEPNQLEYTVTFTIEGGVPPYIVTGGDNTGTLSGNTFTETLNFAANPSFDYEIEDSGECGSITINEIAPDCNCIAQGSISGSTTICQGSCAVITFNLIGDGPFNVQYSAGNAPATNLNGINNGHTITVCPGANTTYTLLSVADTYCEGVVTGSPVNISLNPPINVTGVTQIASGNNETYQVQFNVSGGVPNFNFTPAGGNYNSGTGVYTSAPIPCGNGYNITVDDQGACPPIVVSLASYNCPCISDAGALTSGNLSVCDGETISVNHNGAEVLDGNDNFVFLLHDGNATEIGSILATSTTGSFTFNYGSLEPGAVYYINAVAGNVQGQGVNLDHPCTSISDGIAVEYNILPTASISGGATVCPGEPVDLIITFTGEGPWDFEYAINGDPEFPNNFSSTNQYVLTTTQPGNYTITEISDNNCVGTTSGTASVQNFQSPTATLSGEPEVCENSGDGPLVELTGNGPWSFVYSIDGEEQAPITSNFPSYTIPAEVGGNYSLVSVEDANCEGAVSGSQAISILAQPTATIVGGGEVCAGDEASFTVNLTGDGPFTVQYAVDGVPQPPLTGIGNNYSFLSGIDGDYVIQSIQDQNCTGVINQSQASLVVNPLPTASITTTSQVACIGEELDLTVDLEGVPPFTMTYMVNDDTITVSGIVGDYFQTFEPQGPISVQVLEVEDGSDPTCVSEIFSVSFIDVVELPNAPVLTSDTVCANTGMVSIGVNAAPGLTYEWSPADRLTDATASNPGFQTGLSGPFAKTFTYVLTATNGQCSAKDTMTIRVDPGPRAQFDYSPDPVMSEDPTVFFNNTTLGGENIYYYWEIDSLTTSEAFSPVYKFPDGINAEYAITLTATDMITGCTDEYTEILTIKPEMLIFVPSAFTPDGDGLNDLWAPVTKNIDPDDYRLTVFNRNGEIVFTTRDVNQKWNGSMNGDSYFVEPGVYVWMIDTKNIISLEEIDMKGIVTVVR